MANHTERDDELWKNLAEYRARTGLPPIDPRYRTSRTTRQHNPDRRPTPPPPPEPSAEWEHRNSAPRYIRRHPPQPDPYDPKAHIRQRQQAAIARLNKEALDNRRPQEPT